MSKSLFSKEEKSSFEVAKTGGDVDVIVSQLIIHAHDKDDTVRLSLTLALNELGTKQPVLMVSTLTAFCLKNPKLDQGHRVQLLKVMTTVLESSRDLIPEPLATDVIAFASREMTGSDDVIADLQGPASTVLTLLSVPYPNIVIDRLLSLFKAGEVPHYYVVKTFADVAVANGVAFTLRLRDVLTRMTPVLGNIKKSPMKWVFATAFGRFAEAMSHFQANADDTAKLQVQPAHFELDMGSAFDVMSTKWLDDKEPKVRFGVIESLGFMAGTINRQDFEVKWLPRLVPTYINMYKKEKPSDYLPISHGFCQLMTEAVRNDSQCIVPLLPIILAGIHPLVCRPPSDFQNQTAMKNHGELLRCFEILGRAQLEQVLHFVINRFQLKESMTRIGSLVILRHYVNSMDAILEDKKPLIMSSVNTLIGETDLTVKKSIMQLIVSMSNQGYLTMEGGQSLVRFIIQQCAIPVDDHADADVKNPNITTPLQIRNAGNHILQVMATKQVNMRSVLWPYMLELIIDPEYSPAIVIIFKCIEHIGTAKRAENAPDYKINFEAQVNIPHAQHFLCRLMILASEPFRKKDMGMTMCRAMLALGPIIHEKIGTFWDETVPSLITYLESNPDEDLNISKWQDSLLKLWRETLALIEQPKWLHDLVTCLCDHFKLHKKDPALHRVIQRYMGALLARIEAKTIITSTLELMFNTANHSNDVERQGVAQGYGLCASAHLDTVLPKLTERLEPAEKKKSGFFSSFGNKKEDDVDDTIKATVMLCYGYVAAYANPELIISRLDVHILHNLIPAMNKAKTVMLKVNVIKAIDLVGKAVHVSRLPENKKNHKLSQRDDLMNGLISYLDDKVQKIHKPNSEIRLLGLNAASTLANLEPPVSSAVRTKLFAAVLPYYSLYLTRGASSSVVSAPSSPSAAEEKQPTPPTSVEEDSNVTEMIYANLNTLLSSILHMEPTVPSLIDMLKLIEEYVSSAKVLERERSCTSCLVLLKKFVSKCVHEKTPQDAKLIPELGHHLGVFLPRVTDADLTIRQTATENIQALLYINQILENPDNPKPVQEIKLITEIRNRLECESMEDRLAIIRDLASLLSAVVNTTEQIRLLITLFLGLNDPDADGALGAAEMFKGLIERKGSEMISEIRPLVSGMIAALKLIKRDAVQSTALATMRTLTKIHFIPIITQLLETPTPLPREVIDCFISLVDSDDTELANQTILHLYNTINETPMDKDKPTPVVMTATAALRELIPIPRIHTLITEQYAAILCTILMRIGTASGVDKGISSKDAVATLKTFFTTMQEDAIIARMDEEKVWEELEGKVYDDGITTVTKIISTIHPANKRPLLSFLAKFYSQQSYVGQRTVATAMLAEFVNHSQDDQNLLKELIKFLLPRVADKVEKVRKQALRGLGNLVSVWSDTINEMATSILSALTAAAEDTDAEVAAEAVQSLTRIVGVVNEETIGPMLISICFRVRPAFDRKDIDVRARSFLLFGALCRFGISSAMDEGHLSNFIDQVHSNIPIFIVHMNDDEQKVRTATHDGFKLLSKLCPQEIQTVIDEAIPEPHGYDELVNKLTPLLTATYADRVRGYIETSLSYFTSKWTVIRGNAAIFTALIVAHATENMRKTININTCVQALIKLLEEPTPLVRSRAAKSLSLLYDV